MTDQKRFRIVMPGGLTSLDTFVVADRQPDRIRAGCLLMTHARSGRQITIHVSRLTPIDIDAAGQSVRGVCPECGKVEGVVEDEVVCPYECGTACGLLTPHPSTPRAAKETASHGALTIVNEQLRREDERHRAVCPERLRASALPAGGCARTSANCSTRSARCRTPCSSITECAAPWRTISSCTSFPTIWPAGAGRPGRQRAGRATGPGRSLPAAVDIGACGRRWSNVIEERLWGLERVPWCRPGLELHLIAVAADRLRHGRADRHARGPAGGHRAHVAAVAVLPRPRSAAADGGASGRFLALAGGDAAPSRRWWRRCARSTSTSST